MSKTEKYLPIIISVILPGLSILTNSPFNTHPDWYLGLRTWFSATVFLILVWKVLEKLLSISNPFYKWLSVFGVCSFMLITFSIIAQLYMNPIIRVQGKDWDWILGLRLLLATSFYIVVIQSIRSTKEREKISVENITLQTENLRTQLNLLRNQLNPHFLFNSLSTLRSMVRNNEAQSEEYILKLSDVYRQILHKRESPVVSLKEELEFLKAYLFLLNLRHENALVVTIEIIDESLQYNLPVFALQLLVENCIKHNIVSEAHPLNIQISQPDATLITVSNNYQPKKNTDESFGLGISYITSCYNQLEIIDGIQKEHSKTHYKTTMKLF